MQNEKSDPKGREQSSTLWLDAPVRLVWEVWTRPEHIKHWWGPDGFTSDIAQMDVRPGGKWTFDMVGPDGTRYPNKTVYREVVPFKKIVHEHFEPNFIAIIEFEDNEEKTLLRWYNLYETKELFELVEKNFNSSEGFKQTVARLDKYLAQQMQR